MRRRLVTSHLNAMKNIMILLLLVLLTPQLLSSQEPRQTLIVATREAPPFSFVGDDGQWRGLSIDLWTEIAEELGLRYEFRAMALQEMLDAVAAGEVDAAVAALTVTADREREMDFFHPFYTSGLGIATMGGGENVNWVAVLRSFFSLAFLQVVLALAAVLLLTGVGVWFFERKRNKEQFGGSTVEGLGSGFWWSAVTMTTVGYGDKSPITIGCRLVALFWMFASIIIISSFTAAIASSLTVRSMEPRIRGPEDFPGHVIALVTDSTSDAYLRDLGVRTLRVETGWEAVEAVFEERAQAAVHDRPILKYFSREFPGLEVLAPTLVRQDSGLLSRLAATCASPST
jgi:polar amino acid transport system substrate-binding protein